MVAVNLKQIAERANVSLATASRVLSGSRYPVTEETRQRVLRAAEELDYVPNANARGLLSGRSRTVGVIVGDVSDSFFAQMVGGIHEVADRAGYMVAVVNTYREPGKELDTVVRFRAQRVDIMIVAASGLTDEQHTQGIERQLRGFVDSGNSGVLIGHHRVSERLGVSRVLMDHRESARQLAQHLHDLGHRRVAMLAGTERLLTITDRVEGFRDVFGGGLVECGAEPNRDGGYEATGRVLAQHPEVTAIACGADQLAFGALTRLRESGVDVPGQISVTGFNDISPAADMVPSLTTMHLPLEEMGRLAMQLGLRGLDGDLSVRETYPRLVVRSSTGPARS
ncbi:LacI family transcriptional regulator [Brachybacterium muris]|uniref:LacI family DNA-binding transcriptional regulator n=1 Tax=Brachybacterium muris TaxID=219301 RepID=UPI00195A0F44|nr:LacI family DNA-binding transcriptional regulator [Brachybacterium muris]MBM7501829.1 LacI family transcriptional regulator [Brachybacterium muris]MCT1431697.1 LacI family transcriptional regulator [Brachybacterium muris]MCT2178580.1 LacI family transcriptional regulator [Brachybacterium muris]MCT2261842.1 LacI family transcriptional regulator [Brachybacterium muris]MCT2297032.1 LacI family transcriptional regulator [Brachybacterium muris]